MVKNISNLYNDWFIDYASYVILERAIPRIDDGLKPVQRRILHAMKEVDDGKYNKVANLIGQTMQYHPHGDAAISDALVVLGQKNLLIDTQGNWGDSVLGDKAAAPRYIEARLSDFALDVIFNNEITEFQKSYDARKEEPVVFPNKFPILLALGAEGIAVGLSTKILPHNFNELIKSSIKILQNKSTKILPDFQNGGIADFSKYNRGQKGGKVRLRSIINIVDNKTLMIKSVPYQISTSSLIESILKANDSSKIKISKVEDNTAEDVEIIIHLKSGVSPQVTINALYAFTNCEISISPNCCIIKDGRPEFVNVDELLDWSTKNTVKILEKELKLKLRKLKQGLHRTILERIFIDNKLYKNIEECNSYESILNTINKSLIPFSEQLVSEVLNADLVFLSDIKIKKISIYDRKKTDNKIDEFNSQITQIKNNLNNLVDYSISYFEKLLEKYGKFFPRKTKSVKFDTINVREVSVVNSKVFIDKETGYIGTELKDCELIGECSNYDVVLVFFSDGHYKTIDIASKVYVGKNIKFANIWKANDKHMVYNIIYKDLVKNISYVKRFSIISIMKNKDYSLNRKFEKIKLLYLTANPNSESEIIHVTLHYKTNARKKSFDFDFSNILIKNRNAIGNIITKYNIQNISRKSKGESTLGGKKYWLDESIGTLNNNKIGSFLGEFNIEDKLLIINQDGTYLLDNIDLNNRYDMQTTVNIEKFDKEKTCCIFYFDGAIKKYFIKRFKIETSTILRRFQLIKGHDFSKILLYTSTSNPVLRFKYSDLDTKEKKEYKLIVNDFVEVSGWKAIGKTIGSFKSVHATVFDIDSSYKSGIAEDNNQETLF